METKENSSTGPATSLFPDGEGISRRSCSDLPEPPIAQDGTGWKDWPERPSSNTPGVVPSQTTATTPKRSRPEALATIQIDNERLRVTEWRFAPGTETGWHVHPSDYVVVPMTTGALVLETCEGSITNELTAGVSYTRPAGSEHNVFNDAQTEFVFVEIELK